MSQTPSLLSLLLSLLSLEACLWWECDCDDVWEGVGSWVGLSSAFAPVFCRGCEPPTSFGNQSRTYDGRQVKGELALHGGHFGSEFWAIPDLGTPSSRVLRRPITVIRQFVFVLVKLNRSNHEL